MAASMSTHLPCNLVPKAAAFAESSGLKQPMRQPVEHKSGRAIGSETIEWRSTMLLAVTFGILLAGATLKNHYKTMTRCGTPQLHPLKLLSRAALSEGAM